MICSTHKRKTRIRIFLSRKYICDCVASSLPFLVLMYIKVTFSFFYSPIALKSIWLLWGLSFLRELLDLVCSCMYYLHQHFRRAKYVFVAGVNFKWEDMKFCCQGTHLQHSILSLATHQQQVGNELLSVKHLGQKIPLNQNVTFKCCYFVQYFNTALSWGSR